MLLNKYSAHLWPSTVKHVPAWFPGAEFQRKALEWKKSTTAMVEVPFKAVKNAVVSLAQCLRSYLADLVLRLTA